MKMNTKRIKWALAVVLVLALVTGVWAAQTIGTTPIAGRVKTLAVTGAATVGAKLTALTLSVGQTSTLVGTTTFGNGYSGTGATMTGSGALSTKGNLAVGGTSTTTGAISGASTITAAGAATFPKLSIVNEATATRTVTGTDYGKIVLCSYAGANTVTLPDPSSGAIGSWLYIGSLVDQNLTIVGGSTSNNNQIIADGVLTSDNVVFSTGSHKVGALARVVMVSASKWMITNASSCTMVPEPAD